MLKAGCGRIEITPPTGLELAGYPHYPRYNTGAHDPLYAACMYLNNGKEEVAMVTLDILFFSKIHIREVRRLVEAACGMNGKHIMVCCAHTHSGPWAAGRVDIESLEAGAQQPEEYVRSLIDGVTKLIIECRAQTFVAELGGNFALCGAESGVGGNRRIPGGPHDPNVSVIAVRDETGDIRGVFTNYTLHPTFIHEWSTVCTADYPGYLKLQVQEYAPNAVVGFTQGACGNQSSRYYRQGESYDEAERVGRALGRAACKALEEMQWESEPDIRVLSEEMELELRDFGSEEEVQQRVDRDRKVYEEMYAKYGQSTDRKEYLLWQNANLRMLGSEDQLGYIRMLNSGRKIEALSDEIPVEIQLMQLGETLVVGAQGEYFVEYGLYIKAMSSYKMTVFNELANGNMPGYAYTPESLVTGGYETDTSMLAPAFGRHVVDRILDMEEKLRSK